MNRKRLPGEKIGEALVRTGAMSEDQVQKVLLVQRQRSGLDQLFGEIAVELQFVDQDTIERILDQDLAGGESGRQGR